MLLEDLMKEFTFDMKIKNFSDRTISTYNYNFGLFIQFVRKHNEAKCKNEQ